LDIKVSKHSFICKTIFHTISRECLISRKC